MERVGHGRSACRAEYRDGRRHAVAGRPGMLMPYGGRVARVCPDGRNFSGVGCQFVQANSANRRECAERQTKAATRCPDWSHFGRITRFFTRDDRHVGCTPGC